MVRVPLLQKDAAAYPSRSGNHLPTSSNPVPTMVSNPCPFLPPGLRALRYESSERTNRRKLQGPSAAACVLCPRKGPAICSPTPTTRGTVWHLLPHLMYAQKDAVGDARRLLNLINLVIPTVDSLLALLGSSRKARRLRCRHPMVQPGCNEMIGAAAVLLQSTHQLSPATLPWASG